MWNTEAPVVEYSVEVVDDRAMFKRRRHDEKYNIV
jgi:hypothetical protein